MKNNITALIIFVFFGCANTGHEINIPDWYLNRPQIDGEYVAIASGQKEGEALLNGLYQLFIQLEVEINVSDRVAEDGGPKLLTNVSQNMIDQSFGNFEIEGITKSVQESIDGKTIVDLFSRTIRLFVILDDSSVIILKSHIEEIGDMTALDLFEIIPPTSDLETVYTELEKNGIYIKKKYDHNGQHFVMLTVERSMAIRLTEGGRSQLLKPWNDALKKFGVSSSEELDDEKKEEFWKYLDSLDQNN